MWKKEKILGTAIIFSVLDLVFSGISLTISEVYFSCVNIQSKLKKPQLSILNSKNDASN